MSLDYTRVTHETLLEDWNNRILADERFKDLTQASIYQFLQETIAGVSDLANYYLGRVAEENYLETAKLDSSVIKLCKNLGYQPRRPIPAQAEIAIQLNGPLPANIQAGDKIWFNNEDLRLSFDNNNFLLDACYSYEFTPTDIQYGKDSSWTKTIYWARQAGSNVKEYVALDSRTKLVSTKKLQPIKVFQGTLKTVEIKASQNARLVGTGFQSYDIDDVTFSNFYGKRDPFAYRNKEYRPANGLCKIGIGADENDAFAAHNICDIEDFCVEMNTQLKNWTPDQVQRSAQANVVCVQSNPDKTVRIYFGNGISCLGGFANTQEKLFVRYLSTKGFAGRKSGTTESQIQCQNKIYASGKGRLVNVTNNVKFLFNSDILVGQDFESQESMKTNAKVFFASSGKLITLKDFESYFLTLTDPLVVNHCITFGEKQWEDDNNPHHPWIMNNVFYTLFNNVYKHFDYGEYEPLNVYDENANLSDIMMYNTYKEYIEHLFDVVRVSLYPRDFCRRQYEDSSSLFGLNCKTVRDACEERMMLNTKIMSLPPIFHYYDITGDVLIDRTKNVDNYKKEVESEIYEWLSNNIGFKTKIYKSDIITKFMEHDSTRRVNIDIKVSDIVKSSPDEYVWDINYADLTWVTLPVPQITYDGYNQYNVIQLPLTDKYNKQISNIDELEGQQITITVPYSDAHKYQGYRPENWSPTGEETFNVTVYQCSHDDSYMYLTLGGAGIYLGPEIYILKDSGYNITIKHSEDSYFDMGSLSNLTTTFKEKLNKEIADKTLVSSTNETPYALPYIINFDSTNVRSETLVRRGANDVSLTGLNELWFQNFIKAYAQDDPKISNSIDNFSKLQSDIENVYPILKPVLDDNVLDDNNNIVNYSCENEIPVINIKVNYVLGE